MALDVVTATDELLGRLKTRWDADTAALTTDFGSIVPRILEEAIEKSLDPKAHPNAGSLPWARVIVRHASGIPAALGNSLKRRTGKVFVQVFVPFKDGSAYTLAQQLGDVAQKAFDSSRGLVSVTSASLQEKGFDASWYRVDCTVDFYWMQRR